MRRIGLTLAALVVAASLAAAATAGTVVKVGPKANGTTVGLHQGDVLVVSLPGNATTGFAWRLRAFDRTMLKLVSSRYVPRTSGGKVGTGGTFVFRLSAFRAGQTTLRLAYVQAGSTRVARAFRLRVTVAKPPPKQI